MSFQSINGMTLEPYDEIVKVLESHSTLSIAQTKQLINDGKGCRVFGEPFLPKVPGTLMFATDLA